MNLSNLFEQTHKLPNIPKVVQELIETFNDEEVDMEAIAEKIALDPVLTAKTLRLANSAYYGVSKTVSSTTDASVLLGFDTIRTLVLASGITGAVQTPDGFDRRQFWRYNFTVAALAKWLASYSSFNPEKAFTTAMLHSIGQLLISLIMPSECKKIESAVNAGGRLHQVEKSILGFDYAEVGAELASRWKFPEQIIEGIRFHIEPTIADKTNTPLAVLTHLAVFLNETNSNQLSELTIKEQFPNDLANSIGLDTETLLNNLDKTKGIESGMDALLAD